MAKKRGEDEDDQTQRDLPAVARILRESGLPAKEQEEWLEYLSALGTVSEEELALALAPDASTEFAPATRGYLRKRWTIFRHEVSRWWRTKRFWSRLLYAISFLVVPIQAAIHLGLTWKTVIPTAFFLFMFGWRALRQWEPENMRLIERNYDVRKLKFQKLIATTQSWYEHRPTAREVSEFQSTTLELIATYMRDHRADLRGRKIFANLLVEDGDDLVVIARSDEHRQAQARYPKEKMLVWQAMQAGEPRWTGDLSGDFPDTVPGKRYNSIMVVPVFSGGRVVGAVSIDSEAHHHFDKYAETLPTHLAPYVQLLAATLSGPCARNLVGSGGSARLLGQGDGDDAGA